MSTTIRGTANFPTFNCALSYYRTQDIGFNDVMRKVAWGEITIGEPDLKPGEKLILIDSNLRYAIASQS